MNAQPISLNGAQVVMIPMEELMTFGEQIAERVFDMLTSGKEEVYLTAKQTAQKLQVDLSTLYRWDRDNYLKAVRVGGKKRYRLSDIEKLMDK